MERRLILALGCLALVCGVVGCRTADGGAVAGPRRPLDVLIEEGNPAEMGAKQYQFRVEIRDYMKRELPRRLARYGMDVRMVGDRAETAAAGDGRDLLVVRYVSYNPGSSAARIVVGYGAGAAALDISLALHRGGQQLLAWTDGCGTSGHWSRIVNKLDDNLGKKLREFYAQR